MFSLKYNLSVCSLTSLTTHYSHDYITIFIKIKFVRLLCCIVLIIIVIFKVVVDPEPIPVILDKDLRATEHHQSTCQHVFRGGRKPEIPEETQMDTGRT